MTRKKIVEKGISELLDISEIPFLFLRDNGSSKSLLAFGDCCEGQIAYFLGVFAKKKIDYAP